jgi:hypothetical protein
MDKEWYAIRDLLFGRNEKQQYIEVAVQQSQQCAHPDAVLIRTALQSKAFRTRKDLIKVFVEYGNIDTRCLCFAWCLMNESKQEQNIHLLEKAAKNGYAFAQTELYHWCYSMDREADVYDYLKHAVQQNERDAFCLMTQYHVNNNDKEKALIEAKKGAELGLVGSMIYLGHNAQSLDDTLFWFGQAATHGDSFHLVVELNNNQTWMQIIAKPALLYQIGHWTGSSSLNNFSYIMSNFDAFMKQKWMVARRIFNLQNIACQSAIETWSLCAMRLKLYKDLRILIAKLVWLSRSEALFDIPQ